MLYAFFSNMYCFVKEIFPDLDKSKKSTQMSCTIIRANVNLFSSLELMYSHTFLFAFRQFSCFPFGYLLFRQITQINVHIFHWFSVASLCTNRKFMLFLNKILLLFVFDFVVHFGCNYYYTLVDCFSTSVTLLKCIRFFFAYIIYSLWLVKKLLRMTERFCFNIYCYLFAIFSAHFFTIPYCLYVLVLCEKYNSIFVVVLTCLFLYM